MNVFLRTSGLLLISNIFMTFAWYAHLKTLNAKPWYGRSRSSISASRSSLTTSGQASVCAGRRISCFGVGASRLRMTPPSFRGAEIINGCRRRYLVTRCGIEQLDRQRPSGAHGARFVDDAGLEILTR